jgi:hypothetical protein
MAAKTAVIMAAATVAFAGAAAVRAQEDAQNQTNEQLLACDRISDPAEKMACFNAVVDNLKQSPAAPAAESPSESPPSIAPASEAPAAIAPAAGATAAAIPTEPSEPEPAAELESSSPGEMPDEPTVNSDIVVDDFGLENQVAAEARQKEKEQKANSETGTVHATIVRSERSGLNHFIVVLDNGQVWEETDGSRRLVGLPRVGSPVKVYKGRLGGYRMKIGDDKRIAWVRRLK